MPESCCGFLLVPGILKAGSARLFSAQFLENSVLCRVVCEVIMQNRMMQVRIQFWLTLAQPIAQPIGVWSTGLMLTGATIALPAAIAQASSSLQWQYNPESAALSLNLPAGTTPRYFLAAQPARIVVDVPNTDVGNVLTEKQFPGTVQQIRIAQFQPGITRIVMQLAPGTVLAPQQVNLQQSGNQWVLRPVLADASVPAAIASARPVPSPENQPEPIAANSTANPAVNPVVNPAANSSVNSTEASSPAVVPELPPLEPGATEIPVELPPAEMAAAETPTVTVPNLASNPSAAIPNSQAPAVQSPAIQTQENQAIETPRSEQITQTQESSDAVTAALPTELPPATLEPTSLPTELPPASVNDSASSPNFASSTVNSTVNVPALDAPRPLSSRSSEIATIEFGQPLPEGSSRSTSRDTPREASPEIAAVKSAPGVLLPAGTVLSLRYQGEETLSLTNDYPLQEVLVVDRDIADQTGQVIVPAGSQVIGRFETGSAGSEFIAQAISIDGQNFLINGRSNKLSGDRELSGNRMARNSAIGAVAGTLLGALTGVGIIAGIAAGAASSAATTYLTAPQPAIIEPDRVVEVRLLEDVRQTNFAIGG